MAYLIERGQPEGHANPVWWNGAVQTFTGDINYAIQFATKESAWQVIREQHLDARPICHEWNDA